MGLLMTMLDREGDHAVTQTRSGFDGCAPDTEKQTLGILIRVKTDLG
jgi:hypothetical protein